MNKRRIGIIADCVCDLPKNLLISRGIDILYFLVETEHGVFTDTDEITAENIISYMDSGGKIKTAPPDIEAYQRIYEKNLKKYDELIHIVITSKISRSGEFAHKALEMMDNGNKVHVFDSEQLSSGMGFLVLRAAEMAEGGYSVDEIFEELEKYKPRIVTTFIARNAEYLYRKGLVSDLTRKICASLSIHPVLCMKNGYLKLENIIIGNYSTSCRFYIRSRLRGKNSADSKRAFITQVGCSLKMLSDIREEAMKNCQFEELTTVAASATISGCCGPGTFGLMYTLTK